MTPARATLTGRPLIGAVAVPTFDPDNVILPAATP
jgi:hypothetical protein